MEIRRQTVSITHPRAHSKKQELIMNAMMYPHVRELWIACGTKYGKSLSASIAISKRALNKQNAKYRWVAPIYRQSLIGMEYFYKILPPKPHAEFKKSDMLIAMPNAHNSIEFWHGQNPYDLEGAAVDGYVFDECAKMKEQVYISGRTTTTRTRGPIMGISTPLGKTWFYRKCMEAKEHQEWAIRNGKLPEKLFITAPTTENPTIGRDVIEQAQKELPDRLFRQHYLAEFIDDGTVFVNINGCVYGPKLLFDGPKQLWFAEGAKSRQVVIGVDWAKSQDYTVFLAVDIVTRQIVGLHRFHRVPYTEQVRMLKMFSLKFADVLIINHDKTGVGSAIDDLMVHINMPYNGIVLGNANKGEFVTKLITSLEQAQIFYPFWQELIDELTQYELSMSPTGLPTYNAPPGKHDDIVCAMFLVNMALLDYSDREFKINFLEDIETENNVSNNLESYYAEISED
jgi:hypothetical protein